MHYLTFTHFSWNELENPYLHLRKFEEVVTPIVITHFWVIPQIHFFSSKKSKNIFELKTKKSKK